MQVKVSKRRINNRQSPWKWALKIHNTKQNQISKQSTTSICYRMDQKGFDQVAGPPFFQHSLSIISSTEGL